jgi:hypothetical protein
MRRVVTILRVTGESFCGPRGGCHRTRLRLTAAHRTRTIALVFSEADRDVVGVPTSCVE